VHVLDVHNHGSACCPGFPLWEQRSGDVNFVLRLLLTRRSGCAEVSCEEKLQAVRNNKHSSDHGNSTALQNRSQLQHSGSLHEVDVGPNAHRTTTATM